MLPTTEIGDDPVAIRDYVQAVEALGFSHTVLYDHVLGAADVQRDRSLQLIYTDADPFHEPLVLFGFIAAVTTTLEMATGVLVLPQRQTALVAKQAAEVQNLSQGRLRLGVGVGWNHVEYEALGVPFSTRGARLDEQIRLLRRLWTEDLVEHRERFHIIDRAALTPKPITPIPVWVGGYSDAALQRAVDIGDGLLFGRIGPDVRELARMANGLAEALGRPAPPMEAIIHAGRSDDDIRREYDAWTSLGGTHFSVRTMSAGALHLGERPLGFTTVQQHVEALERFISIVQ